MSHEFGRQIGQRFQERANKVARSATLGAIIFGGTAIPSAVPTQAEELPQSPDSYGIFSELPASVIRNIEASNTPNSLPFESIHSVSHGFDTSHVFLGTNDAYPLSQFLKKHGYEPQDNPAPVIDLNKQVVLAIGETQLTDEKVTDIEVNSNHDRIIRVGSVSLDSSGKLQVKAVEYGAEICEDQLSTDDPEGDKKFINDAFKPLTPGDLVVLTLPEGVTPDAVKEISITREQYGVDTKGCIVTTVAFSSVTIADGGYGRVLQRSQSVDAVIRP